MSLERPSHDQFFKFVFSRKEEVADLIGGIFPKEIVRKLHLEKLKRDNTAYVTSKMREFLADLVYSCPYGEEGEVKIVLLLEHKTAIPKYPHLQVLRYMTEIWETLQKRKKLLVPVIPTYFYHGKKSWNQHPFQDYFSHFPDELTRFLPNFEYQLIDLTALPYERILQMFSSVSLQMSIVTMKGVYDQQQFKARLIEVYQGIPRLISDEFGSEFFKTLMLYLFNNTLLPNEEVSEKIRTVSKEGGTMATSTLARMIEEGREEGKKEGLEKGRKEAEEKMLRKLIIKWAEKGKSNKEIANLLDLPVETVERIGSSNQNF